MSAVEIQMVDRFDGRLIEGGHGDVEVAVAHRQAGFLGTIPIDGEPDLAYECPVSSREHPSGDKTFGRGRAFPQPCDVDPWFWSNPPDQRLQAIGLSIGHGGTIARCDAASRSFPIVHPRRGQAIALDCVNATADHVEGRKMVEARVPIEPQHQSGTDTVLQEPFSDD